ncbi:hypothetical protein U5922_007290 [Aquicoccus sp. G2-2]|uniref:hypothetical protein n=1 Tax=Aquicoccus sp. G2-2 TaxID=3092120 RepID=UPI002ADF42D1|nr:hypothetical protein [Aquicoccus sp. G2-2]MEA1113289.1 hypothetical protein [Aquicoccus sp. G2-2]
MKRLARISPLALMVLVMGCVAETEHADEVTRLAPPPAGLEYRGVQTNLLDGDLVQFLVDMGPKAERAYVERYAECAAAKYALIRGYGFARHVRTTVEQTGKGWHGDAVYTISAALPRGLKTIDAEVVAGACADDGIPMV